jgi:hypothetical protein
VISENVPSVAEADFTCRDCGRYYGPIDEPAFHVGAYASRVRPGLCADCDTQARYERVSERPVSLADVRRVAGLHGLVIRWDAWSERYYVRAAGDRKGVWLNLSPEELARHLDFPALLSRRAGGHVRPKGAPPRRDPGERAARARVDALHGVTEPTERQVAVIDEQPEGRSCGVAVCRFPVINPHHCRVPVEDRGSYVVPVQVGSTPTVEGAYVVTKLCDKHRRMNYSRLLFARPGTDRET